ncbi:hypothetical protein B0W47_16575 (plasmid) [Komagataeibacter nataicola]|uniref:Uncharacterized protein n=1 Tax=Komagataeibacter nataicola TaxID=265960 RepID=A0A9N7CDX7_9PROT|nr:hypothetical protein [Komagataeibacter nataicola]AQU89197.1 hypothetical protein B0W47_16575 [Komagataeibacter nataicola]PYD66289.1 hypothetical protein CDI09_09075 [Komagataeibacter nataicola]WNM10322.1 hypothetical protein RI056_18655 [Komagataeibacter nataicola]GBR23329.1 hypothetical protein AA0616_2493 [Komagataeibacter nataicola NRIC 0616]
MFYYPRTGGIGDLAQHIGDALMINVSATIIGLMHIMSFYMFASGLMKVRQSFHERRGAITISNIMPFVLGGILCLPMNASEIMQMIPVIGEQ